MMSAISVAEVFIIAINIFVIFGLFRNMWVLKNRLEMLDILGEYYYDTMPSYSVMMLKFWIWNIYKFVK